MQSPGDFQEVTKCICTRDIKLLLFSSPRIVLTFAVAVEKLYYVRNKEEGHRNCFFGPGKLMKKLKEMLLLLIDEII